MEQSCLDRLNKKYHFSISLTDVCSICHKIRDPKYLVDLLNHCKDISKNLKKYLSPDVAHLISSFIAEPGFVCHFCEVQQEVTKQVTEAFASVGSDYTADVFDNFSDFLDYRRAYIIKQWKSRYINCFIGDHQIKCKTMLNEKAIFEILVNTRIIRSSNLREQWGGWGRGWWRSIIDKDTPAIKKLQNQSKQNVIHSKGNKMRGR